VIDHPNDYIPDHVQSKVRDWLLESLERREIHPYALTKFCAWIVFVTEMHQKKGPLSTDEQAAQAAAYRLSDAIASAERKGDR
jgi:hypothetical protein